MGLLLFFTLFAHKTILKRIYNLLNKDVYELYQSKLFKILVKILNNIKNSSKTQKEIFVKMYTYILVLGLVFLCSLYTSIPSDINILENFLSELFSIYIFILLTDEIILSKNILISV